MIILGLIVIIILGLYYELKIVVFLEIPERNFYYRKKMSLYQLVEHTSHRINWKANKVYYLGGK